MICFVSLSRCFAIRIRVFNCRDAFIQHSLTCFVKDNLLSKGDAEELDMVFSFNNYTAVDSEGQLR